MAFGLACGDVFLHGRIFVIRFFGGSYSIKQFLLQESDVGKTRDGGTSVTVKMGKTRDRTVRDIYETDP